MYIFTAVVFLHFKIGFLVWFGLVFLWQELAFANSLSTYTVCRNMKKTAVMNYVSPFGI